MERNEFRERMNQFKKARETNPQLSYWEWKNSLPDNLANTPDWQYNNIGAWAGGLEPEMHEDGYYHLGSRNPYTGEILKPKSHPTYQEALETDANAGYFPYEKNGRTYTKTYAPTGDLSGYAYGTSGIGNDDSFRYVDNPSILNATIDLFNQGKITQDQFQKTQDHLNALKNESEETKQVSQEIDNARQWSIDWLNKRKATGKFEDQLTDDYMQFATNRFKNVMINVSSSPRNLSNDSNGNFFAPATKGGIGGINIRYNPNINDITKYSHNRNSNIIHEIAHAGTIFKNRKYSDEDWNNVYSPQIIQINKLLGAPLTTTSSSVSLGDYAGSAPEIYARLQQMRWAMKADPTRVNYTYDELKPYLNIFQLDFGKEKTEALMNTIAFNQNNNSTFGFDNFVEDPQDVISPYNLRKDVQHVAKGGIIGYDDGTDGIKMTPEQEKKFLEDRQKYAAMSGAISPVLDIKTAADFTPVGNAIAGKEIYDAASDGNYLDAGLLGATLVVPPVMAKPIKRYIPTVSRTVADKISKLLDKGNAIKESEWNNTVNRAIERIYDKDVRDRAAYIKDRYGVDIQSQYDAIDNLYTNNYESIPKAKIMQMEDGARAKMHTKPLASKAWATEGKPAGMKDFEMRVRPDVEPSKEVAEHEVNHWWTYSMMQNPDWRRSELQKITKDFEGALHKTNPLDPDNSDYYRDWMEQNAYGINVVNSMKELDIPFTKENVIKFINQKPDTSAQKRAARQFKNMDLYYDWLRTMPLAGMAGATYILGNKEDNSYADGTEGVGLLKYYGAYDPKQQAYVLPVDRNAGVVLPEVVITPQNNTDLAGYMQKGDFVKEAAEFTPVGDVMDLYQIGKDAYEGNYGQAALGAVLFFLPDIIAKPISKGIRKIGKNLTAKKRSDKLFREIESQRNAISRKETQLNQEYTLDKLKEIVDKKELQVIQEDPSKTVNRRRLNGLKFRDIYKKYQNQAANLSLSVDAKESLESLSTEQKNLFMKLLWDDPQYIKFAQSKNLPFDSQDTVDKWIEKQRTSIRGVYSEKPNPPQKT